MIQWYPYFCVSPSADKLECFLTKHFKYLNWSQFRLKFPTESVQSERQTERCEEPLSRGGFAIVLIGTMPANNTGLCNSQGQTVRTGGKSHIWRHWAESVAQSCPRGSWLTALGWTEQPAGSEAQNHVRSPYHHHSASDVASFWSLALVAADRFKSPPLR